MLPIMLPIQLEAVNCPTLIAQMWEKGMLSANPTKNVHMMKDEPCVEDLNVNVMLRSGATTRGDKGKKPEEDAWVRKAPAKQPEFDLEHVKEIFMEAKKNFAEASTLGSTNRTKLERDTNAVKGLQELITRCAGLDEPRMVQKLSKHALRMGWEMWLTAQIGYYEMDLVVLDLGSDANVIHK